MRRLGPYENPRWSARQVVQYAKYLLLSIKDPLAEVLAQEQAEVDLGPGTLRAQLLRWLPLQGALRCRVSSPIFVLFPAAITSGTRPAAPRLLVETGASSSWFPRVIFPSIQIS